MRPSSPRPITLCGPLPSAAGLALGFLLGSCLPRERDRPDRTEASPGQSALRDEASPVADRAKSTPRASDRATKFATQAKADPLLREPFSDDFERAAPGPNWRLTGDGWQIEDGQLCAERARNHPAWLARRLPLNATVEFDATSHSADGDIKVELWGDGARFASGVSYDDATSYVVIFGGWKNRMHVLARLDEHGADRKVVKVSADAPEVRARAVEPGQRYAFRIERRDGKVVTWFVNDQQIHRFADDEPLSGEGHDHFGFNDWEARVCFDNLRIAPL